MSNDHKRQEPGALSVSPIWVMESHMLRPSSTAFIVTIAGSWIGTRAAGPWTNVPKWDAKIWFITMLGPSLGIFNKSH